MCCARTVQIFSLAAVAASIPIPAQQFGISTYAGSPLGRIVATNASIGGPQSVATDAAGNLYFTGSNRVFKLDTNGGLTRIAGTSLRGAYSGDGGPAIFADLYLDDQESGWPNGLAIDGAGNVFIA